MRGKRASMEDFYHAQVPPRLQSVIAGASWALDCLAACRVVLVAVLLPLKSSQPFQELGMSYLALSATTRLKADVLCLYSSRRTKAATLLACLECLTVSEEEQVGSIICLSKSIQSTVLISVHFAGHGGPNAASFVKSTLFESLLANPKFSTDVRTALGEFCGSCLPISSKMAEPGLAL